MGDTRSQLITAAMVLGAIAVVLVFVPFDGPVGEILFGVLSGLTGIAALMVGADRPKKRKKPKKKRGSRGRKR